MFDSSSSPARWQSSATGLNPVNELSSLVT